MKIPDLELMLFTDGELDEERARRVRVARLHHPEVGDRLENMERIGEFVRAWAVKERVDARAERRRMLRAAARRRLLGTAAVMVAALVAVAGPGPLPGPSRVEVALAPAPAVAIESVDFGTHGGTVFVVEAGDSVTPVVWLADDAKAGG
jgi:hypothetical protein